MSTAHEQNRRAWNRLVAVGDRLAAPARDDEFARPLEALDSAGWLGGDVARRRVLCLAAGGGRQGPLFAAAGAEVTVVDLSDAMLAQDRCVAAERRLALRTIQASMDDLSNLADASFDLVWQAVSTCYVPDVRRVFHEVARVLEPGGLYLSQHKQPASLQAAAAPNERGYELVEPYYRRGPLPAAPPGELRETGALEYLHRWEELLGGMCQSGFVIEDVLEPCHARAGARWGSFAHRAQFVAPYVRIKARRIDRGAQRRGATTFWLPEGDGQ